jgi:hypothetical protein
LIGRDRVLECDLDKNITVIYIVGDGDLGSTLLDIITGFSPNIFSAGELTFITRDSIFKNTHPLMN